MVTPGQRDPASSLFPSPVLTRRVGVMLCDPGGLDLKLGWSCESPPILTRQELVMSERKTPLDRYLGTIGEGSVEWIGVRPRRREPLQPQTRARAVEDLGLEGDHRMSKTPGSGRQVTLISREFIGQIAAQLGIAHLDPARLRRNIVIAGLNLNALRRQRFWVGDALLEATQLCHPCARMEAELGPGGFVAMFGYGGLCAKVLEGGAIELGATVRLAHESLTQ